jgi:hypothetical protein
MLVLLAFILASNADAGWFDNGERDRRIQLEHELQQQRQSTGGWMVIAAILASASLRRDRLVADTTFLVDNSAKFGSNEPTAS